MSKKTFPEKFINMVNEMMQLSHKIIDLFVEAFDLAKLLVKIALNVIIPAYVEKIDLDTTVMVMFTLLILCNIERICHMIGQVICYCFLLFLAVDIIEAFLESINYQFK